LLLVKNDVFISSILVRDEPAHGHRASRAMARVGAPGVGQVVRTRHRRRLLKFATKEIPHTANSDYLYTAMIILASAVQNRMNQRTTL
jgi:hypothetical protein